MTCVAIIQARMSSSRLPGKVLQLIEGRTMLEMVVQRLSRSKLLDGIVIATTTDLSDDPLEVFATDSKIEIVRGSSLDVLSRYVSVLDTFPEITEIVRVTADCPFIDPGLVDELIERRRAFDADYVSNRLPPPWKRTYPLGLDVEVCTAEALRSADKHANQPFEREHVMPYLYEVEGRFKIDVLDLEDDLSEYRWTVDTELDLQAVRELAKLCGPEPYSWTDVLEVSKTNPWISEINSDVPHKSVSETDHRWVKP